MKQNLSNNDIKKYTYRLSPEVDHMLEEITSIQDINTKNAAVSEAIKFYYGYLTSNISQDYLCGTLGAKLEATQNRGVDRLSRLLYKVATELNLNTKIIAADKGITKERYSSMRVKAMKEVNSTQGIINLYEAGLEKKMEKEDL